MGERLLDGLKQQRVDRAAFWGCVIAAACIAFYFHNKFWWGPDEGFYAYIADRILKGEVVHKDIQALHPGLLYYINALFLKISAGDPVGLRYPLIAITIFQTGLAFLLCKKFGLFRAIAASIAMIGFSFIQFVNPTPNWYLITITLGIAYVFETRDTSSARTLLFIGMLVGVGFLMRQLTGTFLAIGVTAALFLKHHAQADNGRHTAGSIILALLGLCLSVFIISSANIIGFILFGLFPPAILFLAAAKLNLSWWASCTIIINLVIGAFIVSLPLVIYHIATGSFSLFLYDSLIAPFGFSELNHVEKSSYASLIYFPINGVMDGDLSALLALLYWVALLLINAILATHVLSKTFKQSDNIPSIGILVLFHSLVALIYEIPIYLTYSTGLILVALLASNIRLGKGHGLPIIVIILSSIGLYSHAGQPLTRSLKEIALHHKTHWTPTPLIGTSIHTDAGTASYYEDIVKLVETCTSSTDKIFALPINPEIYFLTKRQSAFVFINSAYGLANNQHVEIALNKFNPSDAPSLVLHKQQDKYNTKFSDAFLADILKDYKKIGDLHDLTIYQRSGHSLTSNCQIVER